MNNSFHLTAETSQKKFETSNSFSLIRLCNWLGRMIMEGFSYISLSFQSIASHFYTPAQNPKPLQEKEIVPIKTEKPQKKESSLDLSNEELGLFASGAVRFIDATVGLPWGTKWLAGPFASVALFHSSLITRQTSFSSLLLLTSLQLLNSNNQPVKPFEILKLSVAPLASAAQGELSYRQTAKALKGIKTCIDNVGKENSLIIGRNLFVHSVNILTAAWNFSTSVQVAANELIGLSAYGLKFATSEEYAKQVFEPICPVPFQTFTPYPAPKLPENPSYLQSLSHSISMVSHRIHSGVPLCHYDTNSPQASNYQKWHENQALKLLGPDWTSKSVSPSS